MEKFAVPAGVKVMTLTNLELVPCVEAGQQMSPVCLNALKEVLQPAADQGADYLVLGCTHYPFLNEAIHHLLITNSHWLIRD